MTKYETKAQKQKEKAIKRTLRKARVPKDATTEQAKAYLIHYIGKAKKIDYYSLKFTDEQLLDPNFLLGLYRANINMVNFASPNPKNEELQDNIDFMIEYLKINNTKAMMDHPNADKYYIQNKLKWTIKNYTKAMSNPKFILKLAETFPNQEIIPLVKDTLLKVHSIYDKDRKQKEEQDQARYKECLSNLPVEFLCEQVKKYGWHSLDEIPNDIPNFNQLVSVGIDVDGFMILDRLDITQVLDNKDLIIKAYKQEGFRALVNYIQDSLSPLRTQYYWSHGEEHDYKIYDKRYEEVQKALMASPEIKAVFEKEKMIVKTREIKTNIILIESSASEENGLSK